MSYTINICRAKVLGHLNMYSILMISLLRYSMVPMYGRIMCPFSLSDFDSSIVHIIITFTVPNHTIQSSYIYILGGVRAFICSSIGRYIPTGQPFVSCGHNNESLAIQGAKYYILLTGHALRVSVAAPVAGLSFHLCR